MTALQFEIIELPRNFAVLLNETRKQNLHADLDKLTASAVDHPKHKAFNTAIRRNNGDFALHWDAHGLSYGNPHGEFLAMHAGRDVIFNGSRGALVQARAVFPGLIVLRISAPSRVLAERLAARGRETREQIEARLCRASYELPKDMPVIDVVNDATPQIGIARMLAALQPVSA